MNIIQIQDHAVIKGKQEFPSISVALHGAPLHETTLYVQTADREKWKEALRTTYPVCLDASILLQNLVDASFVEELIGSSVSVSFPLGSHQAFQKLVSTMSEWSKQGVLRVRRKEKERKQPLHNLLVSDLFNLSLAVGEMDRLHIRHSSIQDVEHVIVMIRFKNEAMGHYEFTISREAEPQLYAEWSGREGVVEYNSEDATPFTIEGDVTTSFSSPVAIAPVLFTDTHLKTLRSVHQLFDTSFNLVNGVK
ncbi:hypothetical protein [Priestia koreensis]|uniref:hypothetical protein n=1 Tax=Priestia koreensis TaxID=284581 RepID=UPI00203BE589|nr:hypothetical protein [Priestia koreensis]MCM3003495.1 hypothetical protein [Priestia koreensis]